MSPTDLFAKHQCKARCYAYSFQQGLPVWVDYEDLYSAALIGLWQACQTWNPTRVALNTHIKHCAKRSIIDMLRQWYGLCHWYRPHKERVTIRCRPCIDGAVDYRRSPQHEYEDTDEIEAALRRVPRQHRELLKDYFLLGLTQQEIARKHNRCPSDVSRALAPYIKRAGITRNYEKVA